MKRIAMIVSALALVVGMFALAGCSCSSNTASSSSSASKSSSSSVSSSASSSSASSSSVAPKDVKVPDLKGKTQAEAEKALADVKLVGVASNPEETTEVEPGKVFKQSIAAGTTVKEGEKVAFTVAVAPTQVEVPDVLGKTRDEAKQAITDMKLNFENTVEYNSDVEKGRVISQNVAAGTKVATGSLISVVVSLGAEPTQDVQVPDVVNMTWADAKSELESAGLQAAYTGEADGDVVSQDVAAGTMVAPNTTVTLTLEASGQDALMNYVGPYGYERAVINVGDAGNEKAKIDVVWSTSASESDEWKMSGTFDPSSLTITYKNGKRIHYVYKEDGSVKSREVVYEGGTGSFTFGGDGTLTWNDAVEHVADGTVFKFAG